MPDPLGLIGSSGAGPLDPRRALAGGAAPTPSGPSFKDVLMKNLVEVNQLQQDASSAIEDLTAGKRTDLEGVMIAVEKADTAFRAVQAIRNKVIQAYEEIQQTRV